MFKYKLLLFLQRLGKGLGTHSPYPQKRTYRKPRLAYMSIRNPNLINFGIQMFPVIRFTPNISFFLISSSATTLRTARTGLTRAAIATSPVQLTTFAHKAASLCLTIRKRLVIAGWSNNTLDFILKFFYNVKGAVKKN